MEGKNDLASKFYGFERKEKVESMTKKKMQQYRLNIRI